MRILLLVAELQGLLEDVLVADHAHVGIRSLLLVICRDDLLGLIDCHLLNHVCKQLDCFVR